MYSRWHQYRQKAIGLRQKTSTPPTSLFLDKLQAAWKTPAGKLGPVVGAMFTLGDLAVQLMQQPRPDGTGNFGPDFKLASGS